MRLTQITLILFLSMASTNAQEWTQFDEKTLIDKFRRANQELPQPSPTEKRIVFMGNSITEGWQTTNPDFWKKNSNFINRGVSGQTTPQMLLRFRADVIALRPTAVVILAGTNDIAGNTGVISVETIAQNIFSMIDLAEHHGIKAIVCSVLPVYDYPWSPGLKPASKIIHLNSLLKEYTLANGHLYLDYHTAMKDERNGMQKTYAYDEVHCTKEGYAVMESLLLKTLPEL